MEELLLCESDQEWDEFNYNSPQGSIYTTSTFLNSLDLEIDKIFFINDNKKIASAVILNSNEKPTFSIYQGIALIPLSGKTHSVFNQQLKILTSFIDCLSKKYEIIDFCLNHNFSDMRAFQWFNYHNPENGIFDIRLNYTGIIKLSEESNFETYLDSIRPVRRQEWRKCLKNKFKIYESDEIDDFLRLYQLTFERQNILLNSEVINVVKRITEESIRNKTGTLTYCVDPNGVIHSATVILQYKDTYYYEFGASDPKYRSSGASVFLMLNVIKKAFENNITYFDMVGINSPNRGDFKLSFNANPVPYFTVFGKFKQN
jgi:lipid II:glycine glycyltransferase (peptidoglycan interpeptide bridge formation enzyme)